MNFLRPVRNLAINVAGHFNEAFYPGKPERAGEVLAQLTLGEVTPPSGRLYVSLVKGEITFPDPSELAQSNEARDQLWQESAIMVGLPFETRAEPLAHVDEDKGVLSEGFRYPDQRQ